MEIKYTWQGGLIYLTLGAFLMALLFLRTKRVALGRGFWFSGFLFALLSVAYRGLHTGHPPMQNLFEFFLCMAAFLWPLSRVSQMRSGLNTDFQDALLGIIILFPAGFVFSEEIRRLPPALQSPLFIPHVASYVAGYVMLARAALMAYPLFFTQTALSGQIHAIDTGSRQTAACGFLLITLGLLLGSLWGKICWSHYWQWDPKEMWSIATWFVYGAYFHYRLKNGTRNPRMLATFLFVGFLFVVLTLTWINVSRFFTGMHTYA